MTRQVIGLGWAEQVPTVALTPRWGSQAVGELIRVMAPNVREITQQTQAPDIGNHTKGLYFPQREMEAWRSRSKRESARKEGSMLL